MSICHLSTVHQARDIRIFHKECRTLAAAGYKVTLIARGTSNWSEDGVDFVALPAVRGRLRRMFILPFKAMKLAFAADAKVIHFHDPELLPLGVVMKLLGRKVVYDSHENLRQDILFSKDYIPRWLRKPLSFLIGAFESFCVLFFDGVVCASDGIAGRFPKKKAIAVRNYPIVTDTVATHAEYSTRQPSAVFTGGLSRTRCAVEMVEAAGLLGDIQGFRMVVAGPCRSEELLSHLKSLSGWRYVDYRGSLDRDRVEQVLGESRVGLLLNYPRDDYQDISSNKLYEYMLAGLPVVTTSIPSWKKTIVEEQCGLVVDPLDPKDIAAGVRQILACPEESQLKGENGRRAALLHYTWASEADKLLNFYRHNLCATP